MRLWHVCWSIVPFPCCCSVGMVGINLPSWLARVGETARCCVPPVFLMQYQSNRFLFSVYCQISLCMATPFNA